MLLLEFRCCIATVSICSQTFSLPHNFPTKFEQFQEKMELAVLESQGSSEQFRFLMFYVITLTPEYYYENV